MDGKLNVEICLRAAFGMHYDEFSDGMELVDRHFEMGYALELGR